MKNLKKWQKILIIVLVSLFVLGIAKNVIIKGAITTVGSQVLGAKIELKHFSLGILTGKVRIKGLKVYNPKGFENEPFVDIPEISVDVDIPALAGGKIHLPLLVLDLDHITVIKNKEGLMNVDELKVVKASKEKAETEEKLKPKQEKKDLNFQIDLMRLNIEKIIHKDYTKGVQPKVESFEIGLRDKEYKNINSVEKMVTIILLSGMQQTAIKGAMIYGAAAALGPVGIAAVVLSDASAEEEFSLSYNNIYSSLIEVVKKAGKVTKDNKEKGVIKGKVSGANLTCELVKLEKSVKVKITARKFMLPKPKIAGGIMHQLSEKLGE